jgi:hypothetical protein
MSLHGLLRAPASSFSLGCRCASSPCVTFTAPASGMTWIFNPGGKATKSVRPYCRLKINTAEAAIDAPFAAGNLRLVLRDYEPDPIPVHLVHPG